jgi:IS5 family transposase
MMICSSVNRFRFICPSFNRGRTLTPGGGKTQWQVKSTIGNQIERILADAGYRGHNAPDSHKFRVFTAGQKRRVTPAIKRQMRRRSAIEPVIGHAKGEHRMGRNYLAGEQGDAINAILAAAGYNFSLLLNWFSQLLWLIIAALQNRPMLISAES